MKQAAAALAECGVYVGTSSWKYPGWRGSLYDESRYVYRGRVAESRFEKQCLSEYAEVFKTACVNAAYRYQAYAMRNCPASARPRTNSFGSISSSTSVDGGR